MRQSEPYGVTALKTIAKQRPLSLDCWDLGPEFDQPAKGPSGVKLGPEELFASQCVAYKLPPFERQHLFAKAAIGRLWRFDFSWREYMLAVEIQGVVVRKIAGRIMTMGSHADVKGMRNDNAKTNVATLLGWSVLRFMQNEIKPGRAIACTIQVLAAKGWRQS
jgi:hypothetical protein